ncbi:MAG: YebC/PmpR family DNA-binding transcriptional regulator [Chthoniobacterales bacterium]|nr:YebC/PmpR family DNA-binding transcriptional regulator [Chthoniobacterales bacterium]MCX7713680.1 YebC/PmpR family DNA-binding transcriptional regulator [Chthoniobacterales bacterium]
MAGHSKWSKVKRIKGVLDARRGKLFSKLSKEITVAAKLGGGNPDFNPRLRAAIQAAKNQSMPNDNIERAIKKGTGELEADALEEITYEGYGPDGVPFLIETATDNKNRTASELRSLFHKHGGNLASSGSVAYLFHRKGIILIPAEGFSEDQILEAALDAGAEELFQEDDTFKILTPPDQLYSVAEKLRNASLPISETKLTFVPEIMNTISDEPTARRLLHFCDALEDCEDVLQFHSNFDIATSLLNTLSEE